MKDNRFASNDAIATGGVAGTASDAAPADTIAVSEPAQPAPAHDDSREGVLQKSFMLTVHNKTSQTIHLRMAENQKNTTQKVDKKLDPGETARTAGHTLASDDVTGSITYEDGRSVHFSGKNPDIGRPEVKIGDNDQSFSVNETHDYTVDGHNFTVKRNADLGGGHKDLNIFVK